MDFIKTIKEVKTFEELLILRDKLDEKVNNYRCNVLSKDYPEHEKTCKYRNMVQTRVDYLSKNGAKIDQIEL